MATINNLNIPYLAVLVIILLLSGIAEYLHLAPAGSFYTFLLLVIGLVAPSPVAHTPIVGPNASVQVDTAQNAQISSTGGQKTPLHE